MSYKHFKISKSEPDAGSQIFGVGDIGIQKARRVSFESAAFSDQTLSLSRRPNARPRGVMGT